METTTSSSSSDATPFQKGPIAEQMLTAALAHMERLELKEACVLLLELTTREPELTGAMDLLGQCYLDMGELEQAYNWFKKSAELDPSDHAKWMFLGQMQTGADSVACYEQGVALLSARLENGEFDSEEEARELRSTLASAYVSIGEAYTTDLCDEKNAEQRCEEVLTAALKVSPDNEDALYANGNLCLIRGDDKGASEYALKCVALTEADLEAIQEARDSETSDTMSFANVATKINVAKLLMELGLFEDGKFVLEYALGVDDSIAELWYLTGVCYGQLENNEDARTYLEQCVKMLKKVKTDDPEVDDQGLLEACQTLLQSL
jgi:tetratricopeptide (TPR) repeat protein